MQSGFFRALGALLLLLSTPPFTLALWSIFVQYKGSTTDFIAFVSDQSNWPAFVASLPTLSWEATTYIAVFGVFQAFLQLAVPGKPFIGPISPKGNRPVYKANGVQCYFITLIAFFACWSVHTLLLLSPNRNARMNDVKEKESPLSPLRPGNRQESEANERKRMRKKKLN